MFRFTFYISTARDGFEIILVADNQKDARTKIKKTIETEACEIKIRRVEEIEVFKPSKAP